MNGIHPEFYILSASREAYNYEDNTKRAERLVEDLQSSGYPFKQVVGVYNTVEEVAFMVVTDDINGILELAALYDQECVLHADKGRECALIYPGDRPPQYIGKWTEVPAIVACGQENYTKDDNKYYITRRFV